MTRPLYAVQIDATAVNAHAIPLNALAVAGYDTGGPLIAWPTPRWESFPLASKLHIDQSPDLTEFKPGRSHAARVSDLADIEPFAATIESFIEAAKAREAAGLQSPAYISFAELPQLTFAVRAAGLLASVRYAVADWSWSAAEAQDQLEQHPSWVLAQFASPTSNPGTLLPGTGVALREAQCDLSVKRADWFPAPALAALAWQE